jgi:hypothetical protein
MAKNNEEEFLTAKANKAQKEGGKQEKNMYFFTFSPSSPSRLISLSLCVIAHISIFSLIYLLVGCTY